MLHAVRIPHVHKIDSSNAAAICSDFIVLGVVRRRRTFRDLKTLSKEIGKNAHAHSFQFPQTRFLSVSQKTPVKTANEEIGARIATD